MHDVLLTIASHGFGIAVLIENGVLTGVVADGDLRRNIDRLMDRLPLDIATRDPGAITPERFASEAPAIVDARKIQVLLVVYQNRVPVGILYLHDLLRAGVM